MAPVNRKKRVLLVHPLGYGAEAAGRDISRMANIMPPLGLAGLAAYLDRHGIETDIVDCYAVPDSDRRIGEWLRERRHEFIGLSCTTSAWPDALRILAMAKAVHPGVQAVLGGPHVSALREAVLRLAPMVDFTVVGEGEASLRALVERGGRDAAGIPGVCWRDGGEAVFNGFQQDLLNLDELPFPAYEKLAGYPAAYRLPIFNYPRTPNASCVSSRGCPYQCSYCDRSVFRRSFRYNSADYVYAHLAYLKERFGVRHVNFYDDQFTLNRGRIEALCRMLHDRPLHMTFNCAVRAEHVDPDLLRQMRAAGCWMASLGIETGDPDLLARHRQNADLDKVADTVHAIKKAGIRVKGLLMMGLPGESEASIRKSMAYVRSLPLDDFNLAKFTPFPGSPIYETIREYGAFEEDPVLMDCMHFVFVPHGLTRARLEELFIEFHKRHYQRPRVIWNYMTMIWKSPDSWRRFVGNLGSFMAFARSNERIRRR